MRKTPEDRFKITVELPKELVRKAKKFGADNDKSMVTIITEALEGHLKNYK